MAPDLLLDREKTYLDPNATPSTRLAFPSLSDSPTLELSVVVPAYNEQVRLPAMLDETLRYLELRTTRQPAFSWEVVLVDDGSRDKTVDVAMSYVQRYGVDRMRVLELVKNRGKGGAVRAGVLHSRGRYVLMADADAATVFADIEKLEEEVAKSGADVVVGSRVHLRTKSAAERRGAIRSFVSRVFNWVVVNVGGVTGVADTQCGFKLFSRDAARIAFGGQRLERWAFDVELLYRCQMNNLSIKSVDVQWTEVPGSKLSVVKATLNMIKDMLRMRFHYGLGYWDLSTNAITASPKQ